MPETLHRTDIISDDFRILAQFCAALNTLSKDDNKLLWYLGEVMMFLPVWCKSAGKWRLSRYKGFRKEAIGIETADFRRICRYLDIREPMLIRTLFRMSILSVSRWQSVIDRPRFRQDFVDVPYDMIDCEAACYTGFVLEMRRCEGSFRGFRDDLTWYSEDIHHNHEPFSTD